MRSVSQTTRSFSTTQYVGVSRRARRQMQQRKNDDLRRAVALYHLTPSFYPTSTQGDHDAELGEAVAESVLGPFMGERTGRPHVHFATTAEMLAQQRQAQQSGRRNTLGELDVYDSMPLPNALVGQGPVSVSRGASDAASLRRQFVKAPNAYATRRARDTAGHGDLYAQEEMSLRSAQVRDALFGTVAGELPGLEIVREREREWKAKEQNE
ncbi:unnamed protein product [Malassezia sympodialis ATCC 42132]|nr:uncharacterized protein MSY001_1212 [Malassezia sympodialis ATCC 42132]CCU98506.1 unnamed protein product [Malassezia sympodialis ATCC 42132]|eukprot:XP_018739810.1 uncharacterized protein MSY001_1212 [Malassezia sympodialis ATCC 42132]